MTSLGINVVRPVDRSMRERIRRLMPLQGEDATFKMKEISEGNPFLPPGLSQD